MANTVLQITEGPDKPGLQWSLTQETIVHFHLQDDALDVIEEMEEQPDGTSFRLKGRITSGVLEGEPFSAFYSLSTRSGSLELTHALKTANPR